MNHPVRVAVIGAGAAGLAATKALVGIGADVVTYEKGDRAGGLWVRGNSSGLSPAYDSLHLNTSKGRTEFAAYPMPAAWPDYPSADLVAGYLADYADAFGVTERIRFSTSVEQVTRLATGRWAVTSDDATTEEFDSVVVANGHNWDPKWPSPAYPGAFDGLQMHAHDHRSAETYRDRRVVVVGMGNSAMDIAVDASYVTEHPVMLSARHGVHILPKYLFGKPADATGAAMAALPWKVRQRIAETTLRLAVGRPEQYGLPAPAGGFFQNHPTISDTILHRLTHGAVVSRPGIERLDGDAVVFTDGRREQADVIVWATGYRVTIPFLDSTWLGDDPQTMPLHHRVFHLQDPSLAFVGLMQSTGAALPVVEAQANLVAAHLAGRYALPSPAAQQARAAADLVAARERWGEKRPAMRIDFDRYLADTTRELDAGRRRLAEGSAPFVPVTTTDASTTTATQETSA
ncbi:flavin-containing monooxygenase [Nocardioides yefusunii]|uniref:Flavin-containing monooxygenase n=1 Tax=Nocardioides yefusunii TaxID=2500546 RepID=A0ABW1QXR3_9ACTN|nr:NAD(P)-binding domain-containing protein [Nocardioides yefusunii]